MSEIKRLRNNSFLSFLSILSRLIPNFLIFLFIARIYNPIEFGKFSYAHTLANTFLLISDFGFDILLTTEIAKNKGEAAKIISNYLSTKIIFVVVSILSMTSFIYLKSETPSEFILGMVFLFYMLFNSISNFIISIFKGLEKFQYETKISSLMNFVLLIVALILLITKQSIFIIAVSYGLSRLIGILFSVRYLKSEVNFSSISITNKNLLHNIYGNIIFGLLILLNNLLYQLDTLFLGIIKDDYNVGIYQSVKNILLVPFIIPGVIYNAFLPTMSRLYKENIDEWIKTNKLFFKIIFILSMTISVISFVYPNDIITIIYGSGRYNESVPILRIASIVLFLRIISDFYGVMLITSNKPKYHIFSSTLGIISSIIFFYTFIPLYNAYGAMLSYLLMIIIVLIAFIIPNINLFVKKIMNLNFASAVIFIITLTYFLTSSKIELFIGIPIVLTSISGFSYFIFFDAYDLESLKDNLIGIWKANK